MGASQINLGGRRKFIICVIAIDKCSRMEIIMNNISKKQKEEILNYFGKLVILDVRDRALKISMDIVQQKTPNRVKAEQYKALEKLTSLQQEAVCDLLSETITDTIYRFLEMFDQYSNNMKIVIEYDGKDFDMARLSEAMGSEIACFDESGWIQRFSEIGRFVL